MRALASAALVPLPDTRVALRLRNLHLAALVEHGFEPSELVEPKRRLDGAGAKVDIVSPQRQGERLAALELGHRGDRRTISPRSTRK